MRKQLVAQRKEIDLACALGSVYEDFIQEPQPKLVSG